MENNKLRIYENDAEEAASIIAWVERRLDYASSAGSVAFYMNHFKKMWIDSFGTLDNVPKDFKKKTKNLYDEMKKEAQNET